MSCAFCTRVIHYDRDDIHIYVSLPADRIWKVFQTQRAYKDSICKLFYIDGYDDDSSKDYHRSHSPLHRRETKHGLKKGRSGIKRERHDHGYDQRGSSDEEHGRKHNCHRQERKHEPDQKYDYRSRSPVHHHHHHRTKHERDVRSGVKQEPRDREYDRALQESSDVDHRRRHDQRREERHRERRQDPEHENWGQSTEEPTEEKPKDKPDFALSGKLTEETNTYKGVVIKYNEPSEARKPRKKWRLYPFKGEEALPVMHIHRQSAFLFGRDRRIADLPVDHPSCSKQHAVLQYRLVDFKRDDGKMGRRVKPYVIDLGSANGTYLNNKRIDSQRYVELMEKDVLKFGFSSREYVLLHDNVKVSDESGD